MPIALPMTEKSIVMLNFMLGGISVMSGKHGGAVGLVKLSSSARDLAFFPAKPDIDLRSRKFGRRRKNI